MLQSGTMEGIIQLPAAFISILLVSITQYCCFASAMNYHEMICQGEKFSLGCPPMGQDKVKRYMNIQALRIYAHTDGSAMRSNHSVCTSMKAQCSRTVHKPTDPGLDTSYRYLSQWIFNRCHGKTRCNGTISLWYEMTGTNDNCPPGINYFHKVLVHSLCQVDGNLSSYPPPNATTPKTPPTTPYVSTAPGITVKYKSSSVTDLEKIILAVCVASAVVFLFFFFVFLYCCDKLSRKKRERLLHDKLGEPATDNNAFMDDESCYADTWENKDAAMEYSGAKPDEFINHDTINTRLSAAPMPKNSQAGFWMEKELEKQHFPHAQSSYDSEENLDMERRMAIDRLHSLQMSNDGTSDAQFHEVQL